MLPNWTADDLDEVAESFLRIRNNDDEVEEQEEEEETRNDDSERLPIANRVSARDVTVVRLDDDDARRGGAVTGFLVADDEPKAHPLRRPIHDSMPSWLTPLCLLITGSCAIVTLVASLVLASPSPPTITTSQSLRPSTSSSSSPSLTAAPTTAIPAWSQVGPDIDGEAASDQLGTSVAVSDQGHRVFVGGVGVFYAYEDDSVGSGNAENSRWASTTKVDLSALVKSTVTGLSCSSDGTIVFAGEPDHDGERGRLTVVELLPQKKEEEKGADGGVWRERGAPLLGKNKKDKFAYSVSATNDGDVIVAGAVGGDYVRVFEWSSYLRQWTLSHELDNSDGSNYGFSVSVSSGDGGTLVVGAPKASRNGLWTGSCFMYSLSPSLLIDVFNGAWMGELFGIHVSSSSDGSRVAVGAAVGAPVNRHSVKLFVRRSSSGGGGSVSYSYDETAHIVEYGGLFGWSVSLSADGRRLAVGAYWNSDAKSLSGKAFVFRVYDDDVKLIGEFEGEDANDYFGYDLAISGNGKQLVVGATRNDGGGSNSGHVRVFKQS